MKAGHEAARQPEQERIQHEDEKAERHDDEGHAEDKQQGTDGGVDDAEQERGADERGPAVGLHVGELHGHGDGHRGAEPADEEWFETLIHARKMKGARALANARLRRRRIANRP